MLMALAGCEPPTTGGLEDWTGEGWGLKNGRACVPEGCVIGPTQQQRFEGICCPDGMAGGENGQ